MPRRVRKQDPLVISQKAYDKIMMWSLATTEVGFLLAGKGNFIEDAIRLINYSHAPKNWIVLCEKEKRAAVSKIKMQKMEAIGIGHSHCHRNHRKGPSRADRVYFKSSWHILALSTLGQMHGYRVKSDIWSRVNLRLLSHC
jgi:hypothetical protein